MFCSNCGKYVGELDNFCERCGHRLKGAYVPDHFIESFLPPGYKINHKEVESYIECPKCHGSGKMSFTEDTTFGTFFAVITLGYTALLMDGLGGGVECDECDGEGKIIDSKKT